MEKFYLEEPSIKRKQDALSFVNEFSMYNSKIAGTGGLNRCLEGLSYEEWLEDVINMQSREYAEALGYVAGSTYFMIREEDNRIVGMLNLRHYLNENLTKVGGHISYGIRPTERGKGYAKLQLYMGLMKAKELDLEEVMIQCEDTNISSDKTIQSLCGKFIKKEYEEARDRTLNVYIVNINEALKLNYEKYNEHILIKKSNIKKWDWEKYGNIIV